MQIAILGREKNICRAELESVFPGFNHFGKYATLTKEYRDINSLGGVVKIGRVIKTLGPQSELTEEIAKMLSSRAKENKLNFGISLYLDNDYLNKYNPNNLYKNIKKILKRKNIKSRFVLPIKDRELTSAQITKNRLLDKGVDVIVANCKDEIIIAQTTQVQDIDSYTKRDMDRPHRDKKVGMLPPKLAQIMINLAQASGGEPIYDPFCGGGVVLQEAMLIGIKAYGSDISEKMIANARENLNWLAQNYKLNVSFSLDVQDATKLKEIPQKSVIVSEGYLGKIIAKSAKMHTINTQKDYLKNIYLSFLKNLKSISSNKTKIVICIPVWQLNNKLISLDIIDQIKKLGYNIKRFSDDKSLIYIRENQQVGREILVLLN